MPRSKFISIISLLVVGLTLFGVVVIIKSKITISNIPESKIDTRVYPTEDNQHMKIKVFFNNEILDLDQSCTKVFPVERNIIKTERVARAALIELFKGPTDTERNEGYSSFFSKDTDYILKDIEIVNSAAYIDLIDIRKIIPNAGTSCGSSIFFSEVEKTLMQFKEVKKVIFAIEGDPEPFYEFMQIGCSEENNFCDKKPFE